MDLIPDLNDLRARILRGEDLSVDEYRQYIRARRDGRVTAAASAASKPARKSKVLDAESAKKLFDTF
jgi:hypothetical protein